MTKEEQIDWLCRLRADLNNGIISTPWNKEFTEALTDVLENNGEPFEGMTNGDAMVALFPHCPVIKANDWVDMSIDSLTGFTRTWWDAPYQKGASR